MVLSVLPIWNDLLVLKFLDKQVYLIHILWHPLMNREQTEPYIFVLCLPEHDFNFSPFKTPKSGLKPPLYTSKILFKSICLSST